MTIDTMHSTGWRDSLVGRDVVVVSPQFWGDYWVSKHWIAYELSRMTRTVFIEPPLWVGGLIKAPWSQREQFSRLLRPVRDVNPNLHVLSPRLLPSPLSRDENSPNRHTMHALRRLGINEPIVLNFGTNHDLLSKMGGAVNVYYCVDPDFPASGHENDEALTCESSDLIYAVSDTYRQHLQSLCTDQPLHVIPHGYAFDHARRIAEDPASTCPPELAALPGPKLGFVGSIHDAYIDIDRVEMLANARPDASIVLIGPYRNNPLGPDLSSNALRRLRKLSNVHLLGPRHFLEVPRYIKYFDACLILVNIKDYSSAAATQKRTHFKWLAYLAMGKPVIAPNVSEAASIASLVYLATDEKSYLDSVEKALKEDRSAAIPRIEYASQFAFSRTLDSIMNPISAFLRNGQQPKVSKARAERGHLQKSLAT